METIDKYYQEIEAKVDRFCHDGFFHYLVIKNEKLRLMLCQKMVPERKLVKTEVKNGELYGRFYDHKKFVLDILAEDELGHHYNLEMQCGDITREHMIRFQCYGFRVVDSDAQKGQSYDMVKPVRQMIINAGKPIRGLDGYIHHFEFYDKNHNVRLPYNISDIYIVQLEKLIMEEIEKIEDFDELMYLFKTDEIYGKMNVGDRIKEAIAMHDEYMTSDERLAVIQRERDEWARNDYERSKKKKFEEEMKQLEVKMAKMTAEANKIEEETNLMEEKKTKIKEETDQMEEKRIKIKEETNQMEEKRIKIKEETEQMEETMIIYQKQMNDYEERIEKYKEELKRLKKAVVVENED